MFKLHTINFITPLSTILHFCPGNLNCNWGKYAIKRTCPVDDFDKNEYGSLQLYLIIEPHLLNFVKFDHMSKSLLTAVSASLLNAVSIKSTASKYFSSSSLVSNELKNKDIMKDIANQGLCIIKLSACPLGINFKRHVPLRWQQFTVICPLNPLLTKKKHFHISH